MMRLYFAAPLFSRAEQDFNLAVADSLRSAGYDVLLPQEFTSLIPKDELFFKRTFEACVRGIDDSDAVIAVVDGPDADSGTCFEIGYAYANQVPVLAIRTDFRSSEENGVNLMLSQSARSFMLATTMTTRELAQALIQIIQTLPVRTEARRDAAKYQAA